MMGIDASGSCESRHGTTLCWAARIISMAVPMAMASILAAWAASYGVNEGMGGISPFHFGLSVFHFWFVPVLLVAIAWKYHLFGGVVMALYSPVLFLIAGFTAVVCEGHQGVSHLVVAALVFPVGAASHLAAWWKERQRK